MSFPLPIQFIAGIVLAIVVNVTSNRLPERFQAPCLRWGWFAVCLYFVVLVLSIDGVESRLRMFGGSKLSYVVAGLLGLLGGSSDLGGHK